METNGTVGILRTFWKSGIIADQLYQFISKRYPDPDRKNTVIKIGKTPSSRLEKWNTNIPKVLPGQEISYAVLRT